MVLLPLLVILDGLDAEEDQAQDKVSTEEQNQHALLAHLRRPHAHGHGEAGDDQHRVFAVPQPMFNWCEASTNAG